MSGEYLVLDGAKSIGLPCTLGQSMELSQGPGSGRLTWLSYKKDAQLWMSCLLDLKDLEIIETSDVSFSTRLQQVIRACLDLGGHPLDLAFDYTFITSLEFDPAWGLGSSSTFIANIADFFNVNPYKLLERTFGGSGYDIAAAQAKGPFYYQLNAGDAEVSPVDFRPEFRSALFFVYLNEKQNSRTGIKNYKSVTKNKDSYIERVSAISESLMLSDTLGQFSVLMDEHEQLISELMDMQPVKDRLFSDFAGSIKSLGAWGGDFVLACSAQGPEYLEAYFKEKGYNVILSYDQIIKYE